MKKILPILLIITSNFCFCQIEYPICHTDSLGEKVVTMTLQQARELDNKTDLLPLYEKMSTQIGEVDSSCIKTILEKDRVITNQDKVIKESDILISTKNKQINNLENQIIVYKEVEKTYQKEIENKNKEIDLHLCKIKSLKGKVFILSGVGLIAGLITGLVIP